MSDPVLCPNCGDGIKREAVIAYLPDAKEKWTEYEPTLWCFGCFIENHAAVAGSVYIREREDRDSTSPYNPLASDVDIEVRRPKGIQR